MRKLGAVPQLPWLGHYSVFDVSDAVDFDSYDVPTSTPTFGGGLLGSCE
jgi:hypothetical protein